MDGFDFVKAVRNEPGFAGGEVVAVTGVRDRRDPTRLLSAGFDGHLVKPVEYDALLATLDRVLRVPPKGA
jgi:CheY-like chemotaxis protein